MPERFRILHLAATDSGGPGRSAVHTHRGLLALGQDSTLLLREKTGNSPSTFIANLELPTSVRESAFSIDVFQKWYLDHNRTAVSNSQFTLGETGLALEDHPLVGEADILHLHSVARFLSPAAIATLAGLGKPVVWSLHDHRTFTGGCHFPASCEKYKEACSGCPQLGWDPFFITEAQLADALQMIPAKRVTFVTGTDWLAQRARSSALLKNTRIEVIPYAVDTSIFQTKWKPQAKSHLGLDVDSLHLLFVASKLGEARKGFEQLAKALQICLTRPQFKDKAERGEIALISLGHPHPSLGSLGIPYVCLGHLDSPEEMSQLYGAADLFLLPSVEENLPNTLLEAMSCGTPAVAFGVGGVPEIMTDDVTGKLVRPGAFAEFALAIEELLFDDLQRERMSEACRQKIVDDHHEHLPAQKYWELYQQLMRGLPRTPRTNEFGFSAGNDFKIEKLAPVGERIKQICVDSLPEPLLKCLHALDAQIETDRAEVNELKTYLELQQGTIAALQAELDANKGAMRKQETTILRQNEILGSRSIRMLRQLKLIQK